MTQAVARIPLTPRNSLERLVWGADGKDVNSITLFDAGTFIVQVPGREVHAMLLLSAIVRMSTPSELEPNDLLAEARQKMGHVGLTVIALVFFLVSFWQH